MRTPSARSWFLALVAGAALIPTLSRAWQRPAAGEDKRLPRTVADLTPYEKSLRELYRKVAPSTVNLFAEPKHEHAGSGVVIDAKGLVLTHAHHGLTPDTLLTAVFADGRKVRGKLRGVHEPFDLSLVQLDGTGPWPAVPLGEPSRLKPGDACVMLGYPKLHHQEGRPPLFRLGRFLGTREHYLLTSAHLNGGDSGGPMLDLDGKLLGNNNLVPTEGRGTGHTSVDYFRMIRPVLQAGRHVRRGDLLLTGPFEDVGGFDALAVPTHRAVFTVLDGDKPVSRGLIVEADGWAVTKSSEVPGPKVTCRLADGRRVEATVEGRARDHDLALLKLAAMGLPVASWADGPPAVGSLLAAVGPEPWPVAIGVVASEVRSIAGQPGVLAFDVAATEADPAGVRVSNVHLRRPRTAAVLRRGDVITHVAGDATPTPVAYKDAVTRHTKGANGRPGERVALTLSRDGKKLDVQVPVEPAYVLSYTSPMEVWSVRHDGFPSVFVYDGVVMATECGVPLVTTEGKVAGILVARLGTGSHVYAVPVDVLRRVVAELRRK